MCLLVGSTEADGDTIAVVNSNRMEYIHCLADYYLNRQLENQFIAFREGLCSVVPQEWLSMFDHHELQVLISGAQVAIDILASRTTHDIMVGRLSR